MKKETTVEVSVIVGLPQINLSFYALVRKPLRDTRNMSKKNKKIQSGRKQIWVVTKSSSVSVYLQGACWEIQGLGPGVPYKYTLSPCHFDPF